MDQPSYLQPYCQFTLRQAIEELRRYEGVDHDAAANVAAELKSDLDIHDIIHVLFACPTSVVGEIQAHLWTVFGTDVRLAEMHRVMSHRDHRSALQEIGHGHLLRAWIRSGPALAKTAARALRMKERLRVADFPRMLDRPLRELRTEYGIRLSAVSSTTGMRHGAGVRRVSLLRQANS